MAYADVINIDIEARNPLSQPGKGHKEEHAFSGKVFGFGYNACGVTRKEYIYFSNLGSM